METLGKRMITVYVIVDSQGDRVQKIPAFKTIEAADAIFCSLRRIGRDVGMIKPIKKMCDAI